MDDARTTELVEWAAYNVTTKSPPDADPVFSRWLLANVPREVAASFTASQLAAIDTAFVNRSGGSLPLDIRVSVPLFRGRFFLVFLGGPEKRSAERRKREKSKHPLWTFVNVCALVFLLIFLGPAMIGMFHIISAAF